MISLGGNCAVAYHLKMFKKGVSGPFDWAKVSINQLNRVLEGNFTDYIDIRVQKYSDKHLAIDVEGKIVEGVGSYILLNGYGVLFAHEILRSAGDGNLRESELSQYVVKLEARIARFIERSKDSATFIRLETGKLKADYARELVKLVDHLLTLHEKNKLILLIHKDELEKVLVMREKYQSNIRIVTFDKFEEDWRFLSIDWLGLMVERESICEVKAGLI